MAYLVLERQLALIEFMKPHIEKTEPGFCKYLKGMNDISFATQATEALGFEVTQANVRHVRGAAYGDLHKKDGTSTQSRLDKLERWATSLDLRYHDLDYRSDD